MLSFRTKGYNGYGIQYSPFFDNKLAIATAANYGLVGNGRLYIVSISPNGSIQEDIHFDTQDGLFGLAWSESHENHVITANGDGSIKIFDIALGQPFPIMQFKEHQREVFSIQNNLVDKHQFLSTSWDGFVKIWTPNRPQSLLTLNTNKPQFQSNCCYEAKFSPHNPNLITSINANSHIQVFDLRLPKPEISDFIGHGGAEILTVDWNYYRSTVVATAGVDKLIKIWDMRMISNDQPPTPGQPFHKSGPPPLNQLVGHEFTIRKVKWSPHNGSELLSTSYDMTARVWQDQTDNKARFLNNRVKNNNNGRIFNEHREFVFGCDYSLWGDPGWCATTGWDEMCYIFDTKRL